MLLKGQMRRGQRTALWTGKVGDNDTLKKSFSERKSVFVMWWGRNLIRIKVQMRGKKAEAVQLFKGADKQGQGKVFWHGRSKRIFTC